MDEKDGNNFLFAIAVEMKHSLESPVILVTLKDYADNVYKSMLNMRSIMSQTSSIQLIIDIISDFHFDWLYAVNEIEAFRKRVRETPRDHISKAIDISIECVNRRMNQFQKFICQSMLTLSVKETEIMKENLDTMVGMRDNLVSNLRDKKDILSHIVDPIEYRHKILEETEELLCWVDNLYDNLAIQTSKVTVLNFTAFTANLTKTLNDTIDEVAASREIHEIDESNTNKRSLSYLISNNNQDGAQVIEKIKDLENRTDRLKQVENSAAVMALEHKILQLEEKLMSLENFKTAMLTMKSNREENKSKGAISIFDHLLPLQDRIHLVEELVKLWKDSLTKNQDQTSIISILSVDDMREVFFDEFGKFSQDVYGRKLYLGKDCITYQLNQNNILVPLSDDENHVYYYDKCGRYYYNEHQERIYKATDDASEYCIDGEGILLKVKEYRDGKPYWYDKLGRYFLNDNGKRIYYCEDDGALCEHDGLGNLVSTQGVTDYIECPIEPIITEESKYLQNAVGNALKKCIAKVVLCQPPDPILFLAKSLETFSNNEKARQKRLVSEQELTAEREERMREAYQALTAPGSFHGSTVEEEYLHEDFSHEELPNFESHHTLLAED